MSAVYTMRSLGGYSTQRDKPCSTVLRLDGACEELRHDTYGMHMLLYMVLRTRNGTSLEQAV